MSCCFGGFIFFVCGFNGFRGLGVMRVWGLGSRVQGVGFMVQGLCRVQGLGFRFQV